MRYYIFGLLLIICLNGFGQETPQYTQVYFTISEEITDEINAYYIGHKFSFRDNKDSVLLYTKQDRLEKIKVYPNSKKTNHYIEYVYNMYTEKLAMKTEHTYIESEQKKIHYCESYNSQGFLESKGSYENDVKVGIWVENYENGNIKEEGTYYEGKKDKVWAYYYSNGNIKEKGTYYKGKKDGVWTYYYPTGISKIQLKHKKEENDKESLREFGFRERIVSFWDKEGKQLIKDGTGDYYSYYKNDKIETEGKYKDYHPVGEWKSYNNDGSLDYEETYDNSGKLLKGKSYYNGETYEYDSVTNLTEAGFSGGMDAFYEYVRKNMTYPAEARKRGIQGRVFLSFVIDKDGNLVDIEVMRGIGSGCDEDAVRVLKNSPKWISYTYKGRSVSTKMSIPLQYTLRN